MKIPSIAECRALILAQGWAWHDEPGRGNILILRRIPGRLDAFDDMVLYVGADLQGRPLHWAARCTADPGKPSREHPRRRDGTAVWAVGQVVDGLVLGQHHPGRPDAYPCLVPRVPIPVLRYTSIDDAEGTPSTSTTTQIHRASAVRESTVVGPWSEGCTVVANPLDYDQGLAMWRAQVAAGWPRFTVSCLEQQA